MDHHTYAKIGSKKWSVEEKRLLVTKRIEADDLFSKYSSKQAEPWKKFKTMAKIGDYSDRALRKQWLNMVQRYRIQKSNMQVTPLNQQCIDVLNEEWEYFGEIHAYMNQKTTDLHSYALKEPNVLPEQSESAMRGVVNDHSFCASVALSQQIDPNLVIKEEYDPSLIVKEEMDSEDVPDAEGDLFSDSGSEESSQPSDPVAAEVSDLSEPDFNITSPLPPAKSVSDLLCETGALDHSGSVSMPIEEATTPKPPEQPQSTSPEASKPIKRKRKSLSERDKYYRHRRRYEHRMELRLGNICKVAGQLLEHLVPSLNVTPLLMNINNNVEFNCTSSCDDNNDETDDDDDDENDDDDDDDDAAAVSDNNNNTDGQQQ